MHADPHELRGGGLPLLLLLAAWSAAVLAAEPEPDITLCEAVHTRDPARGQEPLARGVNGWIFRESDLHGEYRLQQAGIGALRRLVEALRARGTQLAVVMLPPRGVLAAAHVDRDDPLAREFDPAAVARDYHEAVRLLASTGALVPDLLESAERSGLGEGFYFKRDHHWRAEGARLAMQSVAALAAHSSPPLSFAPVAYQVEVQRQRTFPGSLSFRVKRDCGTELLPPEPFTEYVSRPVVATVDAAALLGDPAPAEIVLTGTSHTNKDGRDLFNAAGWLREATGTDVLNVGVDGGGHATSLLSWLEGAAASAGMPKLLVWEVSVRTPPDMPLVGRQAIPTLAGDCVEPLATTTSRLGSGETRILVPREAGPADGSYVVLQIADPALVEFTVVFEVQGEAPDEVPIRRSSRAPNSGRYFLEAPASAAALVGVRLRAEASEGTLVTARLCRTG